MSRRRTRSRGPSGRALLVAALAIAVIVAVAVGGAGTGAFATSAVERGSALPVAADEGGVVGLDVNDSVRANDTSRLVTVTNTLDAPASATVSLHESARDDADLVVDDTSVGDEATLALDPGASDTVDVRVASGTTLDTLGFDVTASGERGVTVSAPDRSTAITT
ncbi:hypothetical protein J2752_001372 [Halarchaeum rubridurum]|uniref:Uncharacterized protein n=1 Tax=Halarchaeum rubridurum TaxID=489911 RepID=A0A830FU14_9EURY|nr:hypothetical protein [Halarchaeum rubridurum]MBP1954460.1 hypothetical protein [Halarchaeum rubridurum]GGM61181.1 hypothetical protein GCM10009017_09160 [Halarchaeum rubridurum]